MAYLKKLLKFIKFYFREVYFINVILFNLKNTSKSGNKKGQFYTAIGLLLIKVFFYLKNVKLATNCVNI